MHEDNLTIKDMQFMSQRQKIQGAYRKIRENLDYFIEKEHDEFISSRVKTKNNGVVMCSCNNENWGEIITLPTIKNTLARLVREGEIDGEEYELVKREYKLRIKKKFSQKEDALSETTQSEDLNQQTSALSRLTPEVRPLIPQTSPLTLGVTPLNFERDFPGL